MGGTTGAAACAAAASVWVTCGEREVHRCPSEEPLSSPQGFLLANPPGPYTCLRTVGHRSVAMLQFHLDRLWESAESSGLGPAAREEGREALGRRTTEVIRRAMQSFWEENGHLEGGCPECMATVLYSSPSPPVGGTHSDSESTRDRPGGEGPAAEGGSGALGVSAHAWPLATPSPLQPRGEISGLQVLVAGSGRSLAGAKHSSWLRERKPLDELKSRAGAQEVVLSEVEASSGGSRRRLLLEGLTSNFFVVEEDGAVCTAPSGVLLGGIRQLVLSVCEQEGIPFRLDAPDLARAGRWRGAFLTGTGRVLAPIAALLVPDDGEPDQATAFGGGNKLELPVSELEIPCMRRGPSKGGKKGAPHRVAEILPSLVDSELARSSTRLF